MSKKQFCVQNLLLFFEIRKDLNKKRRKIAFLVQKSRKLKVCQVCQLCHAKYCQMTFDLMDESYLSPF